MISTTALEPSLSVEAPIQLIFQISLNSSSVQAKVLYNRSAEGIALKSHCQNFYEVVEEFPALNPYMRKK
jgi:hypothetical protein